MRTIPILKTFSLAAALGVAVAGPLLAGEDFEPKTFTASDGSALNYRVHIPEPIEAGKKYPVILFFHGAGERGDDNAKQLIHGVKKILAYCRANNEPAIILVPQCPEKSKWVETDWRLESHTMPESPSAPMKRAMELLDDTVKSAPVDTARIYVTGISMGGFGTWDFVQRRPAGLAAALPVCGGGDVQQAEKIKDVPIWAFHGDQDTTVKPCRSRDMIAAIEKAGGKPKYTEYPGVKHDSWGQTYTNPEVLKWLFSQKKDGGK